MHRLPLLLMLAASGGADAAERGVLIVNGAAETIREIHIAPAGSSGSGSSGSGPNRLRSTLPPRAQAQIGYSTGCRADIRLTFESGRTETFDDQDVCTGLRVVAGEGTVGPSVAAVAPPSPHRAKPTAAKTAAAKTPVFKPTQVDVPWTGHSITHRFGGLN